MSQNSGEGLSSKAGNQVKIWSWKLNEGIVSRKEWLIEPVGAAGSNKMDEDWEFYKGGFHTIIKHLKAGASRLGVFPLISMAPSPPQLLPAPLESSLSFSSCSASHPCQSPQGVQGPQLANVLGPPSLILLCASPFPFSLQWIYLTHHLRIFHILDVPTECSFNLLPRAVGTKTHLTLESLLPLLLF